ncbi:hypothetical protein GGS24DRAFT_339114 [Hypoxylon argillaceum]|nr:hypothetical protein GGS24DRAFT_339114 [Hypoxylon argillaceum]
MAAAATPPVLPVPTGPAAPAAPTGGALSVIALISGGKDSFYSILHCQANGHRVVALANLYPSGAIEAGVGASGADVEQHHAQSQPDLPLSSPSQQFVQETGDTDAGDAGGAGDTDGETDLNSFMYQTVGHQIIPLYAQATGLPLHRRPIVGTAVHHGLSYENPRRSPQRLAASNGSALEPSNGHRSPATHDLQGSTHRQPDEKRHVLDLEAELELEDETESLVPLLRTVLEAHPEANALCTGAILSTYQRTRVESVALRMGLVPLSYLWQYTELPASVPGNSYGQPTGLVEGATRSSQDARRRVRRKDQGPARDDARLLRDMAAVGLEARVVKVASAGLDEGFLWENVASEAGVQRAERAMRRFGAAGGRGSILGEGGEFETLVIDGPPSLFKGRIVVPDEDRRVIREGAGCAWLSFRRADVVLKDELDQASKLQTSTLAIRIPGLFDPRFEDIIQCLLDLAVGDKQEPGFVSLPSCDDNTNPGVTLGSLSNAETDLPKCQIPHSSPSQEWPYLGNDGAASLTVEEQTVSIVNQIRRHLAERALPATAITNSVIVLRHMSDFPLVNEHYGSLFHEPNPPSRVTISCGDELLPKYAAIAVYLTVQLHLQPHERRGLHVQSRSYWAPANIGPYSQAIAFPLLPLPTAEVADQEDGEDDEPQQNYRTSSSPLAVSIAGQIPLIPASMALPPSSTPNHAAMQITLALQHLWRVGIEMQVRWWTSAVAYFPATSTETMQHQALLAAAAWKAAHLWPDLDNSYKNPDEHDESDDDDAGPDIWDRRYNAHFMTYGGSDEEEAFPLSLPNWSVLKGLDANDEDAEAFLKSKIAKIPFFFAAEVEELPRQAGVEWHAHLGLAELQSGSVILCPIMRDKVLSSGGALFDLALHHLVVDSGDAVFVQTTAVVPAPAKHDEGQKTSMSIDVLRRVFIATAVSLRKLLSLPSPPSTKPKITYSESPQPINDDELREIGALIPCRSLWDSQGCRLSAVCVFETRVTKMT